MIISIDGERHLTKKKNTQQTRNKRDLPQHNIGAFMKHPQLVQW